MSEIEKMYNSVGIKVIRDNAIGRGYYIEHQRIEEHPPFTAKKQIELIKWLVRRRFNFMVFELRDNDFTFEVTNKRLNQTSQFVSLSENNFEEGLAKVLNCFWQDLTEEEKQQVKGILE